MTDKPVQLPEWQACKGKSDAGEQLNVLEQFVYEQEPAGMAAEKQFREQSQALLDYASEAALSRIRSLLEAKAKEWDNWADTHLDGEALTVANKCHFDLLALAATLEPGAHIEGDATP